MENRGAQRETFAERKHRERESVCKGEERKERTTVDKMRCVFAEIEKTKDDVKTDGRIRRKKVGREFKSVIFDRRDRVKISRGAITVTETDKMDPIESPRHVSRLFLNSSFTVELIFRRLSRFSFAETRNTGTSARENVTVVKCSACLREKKRTNGGEKQGGETVYFTKFHVGRG